MLEREQLSNQILGSTLKFRPGSILGCNFQMLASKMYKINAQHH